MAVRLATWLAALLFLLATPAAALGQGAGDDQYSDPFGSGQDNGQEQSAEPSEPEPAAPAPEPEPSAPESETVAPEPTAATAQEPAQPPQQLPYTGADEGLVALAGMVLLAGGVALRLSERARRR